MELVPGGDLQQLAPLPWREACAIARGLCSALSLLHSRRLVHRDLSPRNVRCSQERQAKLIDFGALAPFGASKYLVGTPSCCAPESVHLQPLDGRTDLYGLGATLYQLLLGRPVYMARTFAQTQDAPTTSTDVQSSQPREWNGERGERYRPVLLCHETTDSWVVTGAALLLVHEGRALANTTRLASAISRAWADAGGSGMMFANDG